MTALVAQLTAWQRRERLYRFAWGFARFAAVVAVALTAACAADWAIDRERDTPFWLRAVMTSCQIALFISAVYQFLYRLGVPVLDNLAAKAEAAVPAFGHRLVTALQLNRPTARTAGMSPDLIAAVTREAEALVARHPLADLTDRSRLKRAAFAAAPVALFIATLFVFNPSLVIALVARQALLPVDIPRPVTVTNVTPDLWPSGDEVELSFEVAGRVRDGATGTVTVAPDGEPRDSFPLARTGQTADGTPLFAAKLPASSVPFTFTARAAGGRTRVPGRVRFEPRPVVQEVAAWVLMPAYVDPEGKRRYERFQPQGEVFAHAGSAVRVEATTSKPVRSATVVVTGRDDGGKEVEVARVPMTLSADRQRAVGRFDLPPRPTAYRVEATDDNGFGNLNPPRRGLTLAPDQPPQGKLLDEVLKDPADDGPLRDYEVNGMPLAVGGQVQVGYRVQSPLGIARAYLVYRVNDGPWTPLPLARTDADLEKVGKFLPDLGVFERTAFAGQVEFYPLPSPDPEIDPPGLSAGGRVNFQTAALTKPGPNGTPAKLEPGDRVEYYVAAYDRNPAPAEPPELPADGQGESTDRPKPRLPWRSESRFKTVVTQAGLHAWLDQRDQSRRKLRELEEAQRGVFVPGRADR